MAVPLKISALGFGRVRISRSCEDAIRDAAPSIQRKHFVEGVRSNSI
jgi:hypothetical protein